MKTPPGDVPMLPSQPVYALRPLLYHRSSRVNLLLRTLFRRSVLTLGLLGLLGTFPSVGLAAESLWLDAAKASITSGELHGHVSVLADDMLEGREAGSRGGREAAKYIIRRLKAAGLQPAGSAIRKNVFRMNDDSNTSSNNDEKNARLKGSFKQPFLMNHNNLLAVLPGSDPELKHEYIVVGAHYDHVGYGSRRTSYGPYGFIHNGADDNASGVAALLEVIDAFSQVDHRPRRSILFAFWDGEEKGLLGSKHWKRNPTIPFAAVRLAINIDMVGRMIEGRIEVGGTRSAQGIRRLLCRPALGSSVLNSSLLSSVSSGAASASSPLWLDFNWEYKDNSDHWTFYEAGIPSLFLHTGLHDDYHRPSDDVEKLNIDGIRHVSGFLLEQLSKLADTETLPTFRAAASRENKLTQRQAEQPLLQLAPRLDFYWEYIPSEPASVVVHRVPMNSLAKQAGLIAGDRIMAVNGRPLTCESLLPALALQSDEAVELQLQRQTEDGPMTITLPLVGSPTRLGLSWRTDPAEPNAVYVTRVVPYSPANRAGIKLYDRLYKFNSTSIAGQDELLARVQAVIEQDVTELHYEVETRGVVREVTVKLDLPTEAPSDATL